MYNNYYYPKIIFFISLIAFSLFSLSCKKDRDRVPYAYVNFNIFLDLPEYSSLKTPGNYIYVEGGSRGIILYCDDFEDYKAYDRHCPYNPFNEDAFLSVEPSSSVVSCKDCGSRFSLRDGSILKGPARYWLIRYSTELNNTFNILYVYN